MISMLSERADRVVGKIKAIQSALPMFNVRDIPGFADIVKNNPHADNVTGYYTEIDLASYKVFVPDPSRYLDREGKAYVSGPFDAPMFTLKEWQAKYPEEDKPELLVNANWFNIWKYGVPCVGTKINPRVTPRTFLIGLSISEGQLISSHKVFDQDNVPLDSILFDTFHQKATILFNHELDEALKKNPLQFFAHKNAVSGFALIKDGKHYLSPEKNNNHLHTIPRTGIGIKAPGNKIIVMVIHNKVKEYGVSANEFADLFVALGCHDVINLDNNGSVELRYKGYDIFGKSITVQTQTSDVDLESPLIPKPHASERPKPNFIGFKSQPKMRFFSQDDINFISSKSKPKKKIILSP